jgi:hypothetical protein
VTGHYAPAAKLHTVTTSDNAASIGIPDGWQMDPQSGGGAVRVRGPKNEMLLVNGRKNAIDPTNPRLPQFMRNQPRSSGTFVYPYHGNLMNDFPNMLQVWRRANGNPPAQVQVDSIKPVNAAQGPECVQSQGFLNANGNKTHFAAKMCASDSRQNGSYIVWLDLALLSADLLDQERLTMAAMYNSVNLNQQVVGQQTRAELNRIHQVGALADAQMKASEARSDAQQASWNAQQDANARMSKARSDTMLDQTVVRDVQDPNAHVTVSNSTANWLQQTFPDRVEEVSTPQYIQGQDY